MVRLAPHFVVLLLSLVAGPLVAEEDDEEDEAPPTAPGRQTSLDRLVEHALSTQLKRCDGVEVHRRGDGWIAGKVGGGGVTVTGTGSCEIPPSRRGAEVKIHWETFNVETKARVASLQRTVKVDGDRCPTDFMSPQLTEAFGRQNARVCGEAFAPLNEAVPLTLLGPALTPLGTVQDAQDGAGATALDLVVNGRTYRLSGTITCQGTGDELEESDFGSMRAFKFVAALSLSEPGTKQRLGQWNETLFTLQSVKGCTHALGQPRGAQSIKDAQTTWQKRIAALVRPSP